MLIKPFSAGMHLMGDRTNKGVIYKITNTINGKVYVGQTWNVLWRKTDHWRARGKSVLASAFRKYGRNSFTFETLAENVPNQPELDGLECYWINNLNARNKDMGYNIRLGGSRGLLTEETKAKLRLASVGRPSAFKGRKHTEETKNRMRLKRLGGPGTRNGHKNTPETNARIRAARTGIRLSDEHKRKISISQLGKPKSQETRIKMSIAATGRVFSDAARKSMSRGAKHRLLERSRNNFGQYV